MVALRLIVLDLPQHRLHWQSKASNRLSTPHILVGRQLVGASLLSNWVHPRFTGAMAESLSQAYDLCVLTVPETCWSYETYPSRAGMKLSSVPMVLQVTLSTTQMPKELNTSTIHDVLHSRYLSTPNPSIPKPRTDVNARHAHAPASK